MDKKQNPMASEIKLRRFDGRRLIKEVGDIFLDDYYTQFFPDVEKILAISKDRSYYSNPQKHLGLQFGILNILQAFEKASSEGKKHARNNDDKQALLQSKRNKYIAKAYKEIADGIAWRTTNFARFPMRILAQGVYAGHTWGKDAGQNEELRRAMIVASKGAFVLINDITNCLRIGDLTSLTDKTKSIQIAEIKSRELITAHSIFQKTKKGLSLDKQEERLIQAQIAIDRKVMPSINKDIPIITVRPVLHDVLTGAAGVMKKAAITGSASKMVTPYIHVEALDLSTLYQLHNKSALELELTKLTPPEGLEPIMKFSNYDRIIHTASGQLVRSTPPYTIYPWPFKIITKLITGELFMTSTVFRQPLEDSFKALGWNFITDKEAILNYEEMTDDDYTKDFTGRVLFPYDSSNSYNDMFLLNNPKTGFTMPIGDLLIQMGAEFITTRYIVSVAVAVESISNIEKPNISLKYLDIHDTRRWN